MIAVVRAATYKGYHCLNFACPAPINHVRGSMMVMLAKPHPTPLQVLGQPMISIMARYTHVLPSDLHDAMQVVAL